MRVLIVEDEIRLAENIASALRETGLAVDHASDGLEGLHLAEQGLYDAMVLDLMLPGKDGLSLLHSLRQAHNATPVLILTAREGKESVIELLNSGADDYLSKPFNLGEMIARVKALIRRGKGVASPLLRVGDIELNSARQTVCRAGRTLDLSPTEYRILEYLLHHPGAIISKERLLEHLYDYDWRHHSNVIEAHMSNLRRKLDAQGAEPCIETLRFRGYRLGARGAAAT